MALKYCFFGSRVMETSDISWFRLGTVCLQPSACMSSSAASKLQSKSNDAKPFSEMPGPKGFPFLGNVLAMPKYVKKGYSFINMQEAFKKYGPVYKENLLAVDLVNVCDADGVERVHRLEGKFPRRIIPNSWKAWREEQGLANGILIGQVYLSQGIVVHLFVSYSTVGFCKIQSANFVQLI